MNFTAQLPASEYPPYAESYLKHLKSDDVLFILQERLEFCKQFYSQIGEEKANFSYAPDKWAIKEVLLHLVDSERVLSYRAMAFARGELQALPGFDQDAYVRNSQAKNRSLKSILDEFEAVRKATISLFAHLPSQTLAIVGNANNFPTSVRALAAMIAGHEIHHTHQIQTKYLQALKKQKP